MMLALLSTCTTRRHFKRPPMLSKVRWCTLERTTLWLLPMPWKKWGKRTSFSGPRKCFLN